MAPLTQLSGHETVVPLVDIVCRCAYVVTKVKFSFAAEKVTVVVPINRFTSII